MYTIVNIFLQIRFLRFVFAATIPVSSNLSPANSTGIDIVINGTGLSYDPSTQYAAPLNAKNIAMCDGANFGTRLDLRSCDTALKQLEKGSARDVSFGQRGSFPKAVQPLPMRTSGGETHQSHAAIRRADS